MGIKSSKSAYSISKKLFLNILLWIFLLSMKPHNKIYKIRSADVRFSWINRFTYTVVSDNVAFIYFSKQNKTFKRYKKEKKNFFLAFNVQKYFSQVWKQTRTGFDIRRMKFERKKKVPTFVAFKARKSMSTKKKGENCTCWFYNSFKRNLFIEKGTRRIGLLSGEWNKCHKFVFTSFFLSCFRCLPTRRKN